MDLQLKNKRFIVCGASSGLGNGVATALINEGAKIIAIGRDRDKLKDFQNQFPDQIEMVIGDITNTRTIKQIQESIGESYLDGLVVNAGGPPAKSFLETNMEDWDASYQNVLRWKVEFTKAFLPIFEKQQYGRLVYIESSSVKQPVKNLVLSNSFRLAVVGFVKTLSAEVASKGITLNILGPGFHETPAAERLFVKRGEVEGISESEAKARYESEIPVRRMGDKNEFGMLAAWLLSPISGYITGQTISVDGGMIKATMG
jgi:3-oxoacyl-[acyl-carrier protein] reductase